MLSKQQPQCPVAASSLINQPQPNVLGFPPPQGDWGWARVPRGVRWGWVGGGRGGAWLPISWPLFLLFSPGSSQLFLSLNGSLLVPTIVRASATNHLWGSAGGEGGKRDESGLKRDLLWFSRTGPGHSRWEAAGTEALPPRPPAGLSIPDRCSGQQAETPTPGMSFLPIFSWARSPHSLCFPPRSRGPAPRLTPDLLLPTGD